MDIVVGYSKLNENILTVLKREDYIQDFQTETAGSHKSIIVTLRYLELQPSVTNIQVSSKPGRRMYSKRKYLKPVIGGLGLIILSTSKGVVTDKQARDLNIGGEVLFKIW